VVGGAAVTVLRYTREVLRTRDEVGILNATLEERVAARTADMSRANDEIQRFAYIVTHDLRAPLVNIMGFTSELEGSLKTVQALIDKTSGAIDPADPVAEQARVAATQDVPEAIGFIRSSTKKMDNLINAILRLSREGRRQLRPEPVDLREAIEDSAAAIRHQLSEEGGEIELDLGVQHVLTDKLALEQVIGNLLDNAVKFREAGRPLRIEVRTSVAPGNRVAIEVADNGRGIAERDRERVFELFRRSGVQDQPGEGIGLAHVRTVVRNLGGDITVESVLGQGATFRVALPRVLVLESAPLEP
jgi:signal transduction histidine kinase